MKHCIVIVDEDYIAENLDVFSSDKCRITRTFVQDDFFKDDPVHKDLMKAKKKASDKFYNYEFDVRHKHK